MAIRMSAEDAAALEKKHGVGLSVKLPDPARIEVPVVPGPWSVVLPMPPRLSDLFTNNAMYGRVPTPKYRAWKKQAAQALTRMTAVETPVEVRIIIRPGKRWMCTSDIANREKAVTDALVTAGIIPDDNCQYVHRVVSEFRPLPKPAKGVPPVAIVMVKHCEIGNCPMGSLADDP